MVIHLHGELLLANGRCQNGVYSHYFSLGDLAIVYVNYIDEVLVICFPITGRAEGGNEGNTSMMGQGAKPLTSMAQTLLGLLPGLGGHVKGCAVCKI